MAFIDMTRLREEMERHGIDAMVVLGPENFYYATGYHSFIQYIWRRAGICIAVLPRNDQLTPAMVVSENDVKPARRASGFEDIREYPIWTEYDDITQFADEKGEDIRTLIRRTGKKPIDNKPDQYDLDYNFELLKDILVERGLSEAKIGIEMDFLSVNVSEIMYQKLPTAKFVDSSEIFWDLRLVKSEREIELLREACRITEQGILAASEHIKEGTREIEIAGQYRIGAWKAALTEKTDGFRDAHGRCRVGGEVAASRVGIESRVQPGDLIQLDVGVDVYGCISDVSRIFAYERASSHQNAVAGALIEAHQAMETVMEPGRRLKEVFHAGMFAIRKAGFESYSRGHLGHSVGLSIAEEPPYISASCERVLQPSMIFSLETPYYIYGVGAFNFEDMVLITETGHEVLNQLPEVLQVLPK